jgi:transcription initiation factor TFIIE subunit alpha
VSVKAKRQHKSDGKDEKLEALFKFIDLLARKHRLNPEIALTIFQMLLQHSDKKGLSDEDIALSKGYKQSDVRRTLRLFYLNRIAKYRRGRHPETGATRFYWYIDLNNLNVILVWRKKQVLEKLKHRLEHEESNYFYRCPRDGTRYTFEEAFEYEFVCPKCGSVLEEEDNSEIKEILRSYIQRLQEEIEEDEKKLQAS